MLRADREFVLGHALDALRHRSDIVLGRQESRGGRACGRANDERPGTDPHEVVVLERGSLGRREGDAVERGAVTTVEVGDEPGIGREPDLGVPAGDGFVQEADIGGTPAPDDVGLDGRDDDGIDRRSGEHIQADGLDGWCIGHETGRAYRRTGGDAD